MKVLKDQGGVQWIDHNGWLFSIADLHSFMTPEELRAATRGEGEFYQAAEITQHHDNDPVYILGRYKTIKEAKAAIKEYCDNGRPNPHPHHHRV